MISQRAGKAAAGLIVGKKMLLLVYLSCLKMKGEREGLRKK